MEQENADRHRRKVRDAYSAIANASETENSHGNVNSCCGVSDDKKINRLVSTRLGYPQHDLDFVPEGADMGLGCGNPRAIASLKPGDVVVDLGSGGGFDSFLCATEVGDEGMVIGVDMTADMISKSRGHAVKGAFNNVEFRLGEIEHLPVADDSVDVVISNCVINLSPDKAQVLHECYRVLKNGGRLAISDVVASAELPEDMRNDPYLHSACVAGALLIDEFEALLLDAGFTHIRINPKDESREFIKDWAPDSGVEDYIISASIEAVK